MQTRICSKVYNLFVGCKTQRSWHPSPYARAFSALPIFHPQAIPRRSP